MLTTKPLRVLHRFRMVSVRTYTYSCIHSISVDRYVDPKLLHRCIIFPKSKICVRHAFRKQTGLVSTRVADVLDAIFKGIRARRKFILRADLMLKILAPTKRQHLKHVQTCLQSWVRGSSARLHRLKSAWYNRISSFRGHCAKESIRGFWVPRRCFTSQKNELLLFWFDLVLSFIWFRIW